MSDKVLYECKFCHRLLPESQVLPWRISSEGIEWICLDCLRKKVAGGENGDKQ